MRTSLILKCSILAGTILGSAAAQAAATFSSSAYALKADLRVAGSTVVALAEVLPTSGAGGASYDRTNTLLSVNQSARLVNGVVLDAFETLNTGVLTTAASGSGGALPEAAARAQINDLSLDFTTRLLSAIPVLTFGLDAATIVSTANVGVSGGALVSSGNSSLAGLSFAGSLLGVLGLDGSVFAAAAPNTEIRLAGITLLLNEQKEVRTGTSDIFRYTNALNISLSDYLLAGSLVSGSIIVGHAEAGISGWAPPPPVAPVPEPATWAMLVLGFGLVGMAARRRRPLRAIA